MCQAQVQLFLLLSLTGEKAKLRQAKALAKGHTASEEPQEAETWPDSDLSPMRSPGQAMAKEAGTLTSPGSLSGKSYWVNSFPKWLEKCYAEGNTHQTRAQGLLGALDTAAAQRPAESRLAGWEARNWSWATRPGMK